MISLELDPTKQDSRAVKVGAPYEDLDTFLTDDMRVERNVRELIHELRAIDAGTVDPSRLLKKDRWGIDTVDPV